MATALLPQSSGDGGLKTIQDLYDLINGKETTTSGKTQTTSGGTTTQTTSEGISQDSMDAMLKSALEGTQGLAAVAQGQRTAGGYGSATNRMLINDLMTRTASQIAQQNKNKTVTTVVPETTVSSSPSVVTQGGATIGGIAKTAGVLGGLQTLVGTAKDGVSVWDSIRSAVGMGSQTVQGTENLGPSGNEGMSVADQYASYGAGQSTPTTSMTDQYEQVPAVETPTSGMSDQYEQIPAEDMFADGGIVRMADGGRVTKKGSSVLSTNQFAKVVDPRTGLIGSGTGENEELVAQGPQTGNPIIAGSNSSPSSSVGGLGDFGIGSPQGTSTLGTDSSGGGSSEAGGGMSRGQINADSRVVTALGNLTKNSDLAKLGVLGSLASSNAIADAGGIASRAMSGDTTRSDVSGVSGVLGSLGILSNNVTARNVASIGSIASSDSVGTALTKAGDALTGGTVSKVKNTVEALRNGDLQAGINATASFNPWGILTNAALSMGDTSIGKMVTEKVANAKDGDSLDNYLGLRGFVGTEVGDNSAVQLEQARAAAQQQADEMAAQSQAASTGSVSASSAPTTTNIDSAVGGTFGGNFKGDALGGAPDTGTIGGGINASSEGNDSGGSAMANGGEVAGPGTGTSDSIHAMLSDGEFVLSKDVVDAIGIDKLEALQAKYHTPAAVQKLQAFGKR